MRNFSNIIALWETHDALVQDMAAEGSRITRGVVGLWKHRDKIPSRYWVPLVRAASKRGFADVTYEALAEISYSRSAAD